MQKNIQELYEELKLSIQKYNKKYNKKLIEKVFDFSYTHNQGHYRKSKDPNIIHCLYTALYISKLEADEASISAALLHDILDYPHIHIEDIEKQFGKEIALLVGGVHDLGKIYYTPEMTKDQVELLKISLIQTGNDIRIFLIKLADRYHNLETLEFLEKKTQYRIAKETQEVYLPILNFLSIGEYLSHMHDLCFQYTLPDEYKKLKNIFGKKQTYYHQKIIGINNELENELEKQKINIDHIEGRVKSLYSIYNKIRHRDIDLSNIYDVMALRVIVKNINDAYIVLGIIHRMFRMKSDKFKDYISEPKENGYQSIHTTVYDDTGDIIEFQIQTLEMSKLNKLGIAAHFIYKGFGMDYKNLPDWMKEFLDFKKHLFNQKGFLMHYAHTKNKNILCYDEENKVYSLPEGSTIIDFAFMKHYDVGAYFRSACVNNEIQYNPFFTLQNQDTISIETSENIFTDYKVENLFLLKTKQAREYIKQIFLQHSKVKLIEVGKIELNNELEMYSFRHFSSYSHKMREKIIKELGVQTQENLYFFIAIGSIDLQKVIQKFQFYFDKKKFDKKIILKLILKLKDIETLCHISKTFHQLNHTIDKITYNSYQNMIVLHFHINDNDTLTELVSEIKRIPNIYKMIRIFPFRLTVYYILYSFFIFSISTILFLTLSFDVSFSQKTAIFQIILVLLGLSMVGIIFFIQYIVKKILPDVLRYKRFWISLLILNTYILGILFFESLFLNMSIYFPLFLLLNGYIYKIIFDELKQLKRNSHTQDNI